MPLSIPAVSIPLFEVAVDQKAVSPEVKVDIISIEIMDEVDKPAMLSFTISLWDAALQKLKESYFTQFQLGTAVEIAFGLNETSPIFNGEVTALEPSFGADEGGDTLKVQAYDRLHRLRFGTHQRTFQEMTDSQIASSIADEVGLTPNVEDTTVKHSHVTQNNVNNLTFLLSRAKRINYELKVEAQTLFFRPSREPEGPAATLAYRRDLVRFTPRLRAVAEGGKVEVRGWDVKTKKPIVGAAGSGDEASKMGGSQTGTELSAAAFAPSTRVITDQTVMDADEAQAMAKAGFNRQQRDFVEADGECPGIPTLLAGRTIEITEIGTPFSGIYYVMASTHTVGATGYRTQFKARRNAV